MLKIIKKSKNPKFLIITPLKYGDIISKKTYEIQSYTENEYDWISYESNNNIPKNTQLALNEYNKHIDYIIKVDNDIDGEPGWLDKLYNTLKNSDNSIAYSYCSFDFVDIFNNKIIQFKGIEFNSELLLQRNYISSVSMIKTHILNEIGGFFCDNKYVRLLDYCLWLKMLFAGYSGILCKDAHFVALMNNNSISARSNEDYIEKMNLIRKDIIIPKIHKIKSA